MQVTGRGASVAAWSCAPRDEPAPFRQRLLVTLHLYRLTHRRIYIPRPDFFVQLSARAN